ncbi:hypothetical protein L1049_001272 [Liquidambar formosana]|uniref:Uncharacterized protein n=1 Tax=Liquidambar formosana TaxID=63359 RepID=A0AAP0NC56_LIQFO
MDIAKAIIDYISQLTTETLVVGSASRNGFFKELHRWKLEEEQKLEDARLAEEAALVLAEKEKEK